MPPLTENLLTIAAEIAAIVLILAILYWIARSIVRRVVASPALASARGAGEVVNQNLRGLVILIGAVACIAVAAWDGWKMYGGEQLLAYKREQLESVPPEFWMRLAVNVGKVIGLALATAFVLRFVGRFTRWIGARAKAFEGIRANDESLDAFFGSLEKLLRRAGWLGFLVLAALVLELPAAVHATLVIVLKVYLTIMLGLLCGRGVDAVIASLDALSKKHADKRNLLRYYDRLTPLIPLLRRSIQYIIYIVVAMLVVVQVAAFADLAEWGPRLIRIVGIVFLSRVVIELTDLILEEVLVTRAKLSPDSRQRRLTVVPLVRSFANYIIYFAAGIMVLKELQVDPTPVLAGAGILALAVGLGAQNLINDVVSGFFILFEGHFLVGDFINIGDAEGVVEAIEIRTTRIRDPRGRLHIVRNGQIDTLINYSKEFTCAVVEVGVAYESELDHVLGVLEQVADELKESNPDVAARTTVQGLENFGESELTMRTVTRVKPARHREVQRDLRKRIKEAFDREGIEIPYARRVLIMQTEDGDDAPEPLAPTAVA